MAGHGEYLVAFAGTSLPTKGRVDGSSLTTASGSLFRASLLRPPFPGLP